MCTTPPKVADEDAVNEAYRNYCRAQIQLWTNRVRDAKASLADWHLKLHNANQTQEKAP